MPRDDLSAPAIYFPRVLSSSDPSQLLRFCRQISDAQDTHVVLDASALLYMDPMGLTMLRAVLEPQEGTKSYHVRFMGQEHIDYLVRMAFFNGLNVEGIEPETSGDGDCIQLLKVETERSEEISSKLAEFVVGKVVSDKQQQDAYQRPVEYALKELLENATTHARRNGHFRANAWVACEYHPTNKLVRLAIVDNGCGFLSTLERHPRLIERSHAGAIRTALLERVSCNRGPLTGYEVDSQNQGVGLTITSKIATKASGSLVVASGDAWLNTLNDDPVVEDDTYWQGGVFGKSCC